MKVNQLKSHLKYNQEVIVPALKKAQQYDEAKKIEECSNFVKLQECSECHTKYYKYSNKCHSKYCAICNYSKYLIWIRRLSEYFRNWINSGNTISFMTLTIRDRSNLKESLDILKESWRTLINRGGDISKEFNRRFVGGVRSLEVKIGKNSKKWHSHFHIMLLKENTDRDIEFISRAWRNCIGRNGGDYEEGIVDIRQIKIDKNTVDKRTGEIITPDNQINKAILEVVKYITKISDVVKNPTNLFEMVENLKGIRQTELFGNLRVLKDKVNKDIEKDLDIEEEEIKTCKVCGCDKLFLKDAYYEVLFDELVLDTKDESEEEKHKQEVLNSSYMRRLEMDKKVLEMSKDVTLFDYSDEQLPF